MGATWSEARAWKKEERELEKARLKKNQTPLPESRDRRSQVQMQSLLRSNERPGLNFIDVIHTAFTLADPKSVRRY